MSLDMSQFKRKIYAHMVDNHASISRDYIRYLDRHQAYGNYLGKAKEIVRLNWKYRVRRVGLDEKLSDLTMPEGNRTIHQPIDELVRHLMKYDVVSFDVFDTLILRAVERPVDVFRLLEAEWGMIGFAKIREEAEQRARIGKIEVTMDEIYQILSDELCIDKQTAIEKELQMEEKVCYANPYMREVFGKLIEAGRTVVAVSDMYLPEAALRRLLKRCGYSGIAKIFVSCDYKKTKGSGKLQRAVQEKMGSSLSYIHIGDQKYSDIEASRRIGWDALYYPNVTEQGRPYRQSGMDSLAASFYKGLVNSRLHCGVCPRSGLYEYGYAYGGIMAVGYCQYLERLVKQEGFDQLLFVARDGYILRRIYEKWFKASDCDYIPFSRFAAYQLTMERNWKSFLSQVVLPRARTAPAEKISEVLKICDIEYLEGYFLDYGLQSDMYFGDEEYQIIEKIFREHIGQIKKQYEAKERAAQKYFADIIGTHKKICIVDLGWQGTGAMCLKYFLELKCRMDVHVSGALMGMYGNDSAGLCESSGQLYGYMFSQQKNRDTLFRHSGAYSEIVFRNLLAEILFTEDKPTFLKFEFDENHKPALVYGRQEDNSAMIADIQDGICEFAEDYCTYQKVFSSWLDVCGQEAYLPFDAIARDKAYCIKLLGDYEVNETTGIYEKAAVRRLKDIVGDS